MFLDSLFVLNVAICLLLVQDGSCVAMTGLYMLQLRMRDKVLTVILPRILPSLRLYSLYMLWFPWKGYHDGVNCLLQGKFHVV